MDADCLYRLGYPGFTGNRCVSNDSRLGEESVTDSVPGVGLEPTLSQRYAMILMTILSFSFASLHVLGTHPCAQQGSLVLGLTTGAEEVTEERLSDPLVCDFGTVRRLAGELHRAL